MISGGILYGRILHRREELTATLAPLDVFLEITLGPVWIDYFGSSTLRFRGQARIFGDALEGLIHVLAFAAFLTLVGDDFVLESVTLAVGDEIFAGKGRFLIVPTEVLLNEFLTHC